MALWHKTTSSRFPVRQRLKMMRRFVNLSPVDPVRRAQQPAAPRRTDEDPVAPSSGERPIMVVLAGPMLTVGGDKSRALSDGHEAIAGPEDRVEVLTFLAALGVGPGDSVTGGHAQAVESDADENALAEGDVDKRVDRLHVRRIRPVFPIRRCGATAAVADSHEFPIAGCDAA